MCGFDEAILLHTETFMADEPNAPHDDELEPPINDGQPLPCIVLGRTLGTCLGWDQANDFALVYYNFTPAEGIKLPTADKQSLFVDFESGYFEVTVDGPDNSSDVTASGDIARLCADLPWAGPPKMLTNDDLVTE